MNAYVIETAALHGNVQKLKALLNEQTVLWAVVKGNGYGLGIEPLTELLLSENVMHFAVTEPCEAEAIRQLSDTAEILMLRPSCDPAVLERLLNTNTICTVSSLEDATVLSAMAQSADTIARVHIKIDTGMGRYGFRCDEIQRIAQVYQLPGLSVTGTYTHFHSSFINEQETRAQYKRFEAALQSMRAAGFEPGMCHCCNSSAALKFPEMHMDAVRIGSALLGRVLSGNSVGLQRSGWAEASVDELHQVQKGESTGYGAGWVAKRDTTLAILPIGYFHGFGTEYGRDLFRLRDGIRNAISSILAALRGKQLTVTIKGKNYPVCGHIGMLHTAVDVTGSDVRQGDVARLEVNPLLQKGLPIEFR